MKQYHVEFLNKTDLYQSFMPFINDCGLFIATNELVPMGEEVLLRVILPGSIEPIDTKGKVVWLSPISEHSTSGVGVKLLENADKIKQSIETILSERLSSDAPTSTM